MCICMSLLEPLETSRWSYMKTSTGRLPHGFWRGSLGVVAWLPRALACLPAGTPQDAARGPRRSQRPTKAPCSLAACVQVGQLYVPQEAPAPTARAPEAPAPKRHDPSPSVRSPAGGMAGGLGQRPDSSWATSLAASRSTGSDTSSSLGALQGLSRALGPRMVLGKPTGPPKSRLGHASRQVRGAMVEQGSRKVAIKSPCNPAVGQTAGLVPAPAEQPIGRKPAKGVVPGSRSGKRKRTESGAGQHQLDGLGTAKARAATVCSVQLLEHLYGAGRAPAGEYLYQQKMTVGHALTEHAGPDGLCLLGCCTAVTTQTGQPWRAYQK